MHDFPPLLCIVFLAVVEPLLGLNSAPNVRFVVEPADALVSKGQEVRFDCAIAGADDETVDVQWRLNGITLDRRMRT
ncbi:hypothetical protein D918_01187 [Trichuris suis]|nr:hypothetical protein D918_01187 [Trichuris suis]